VEIERKFLISAIPAELGAHPSVVVTQGYLTAGDGDSEVRLRRAGERLWLTAKRGDGMVRGEYEVGLSAEQFDVLWPATAGRRLEKTRYAIPFERQTIELDVYSGGLSGLVVAEVEFPSVEAARDFAAPGWFGREITDDQRYKNRRLAVEGVPPEEIESV
jgi:CYTH domain-containing protein